MPETKEQKLTTEQLDRFTLRCVVCRNEVPKNRATRRKDTCTVECYNQLKQWRKHLQMTRRCNSCLAPYTERQRAEFKLWRQQTGGLRISRGRPPLSRERKLLAALWGVVGASTWEEANRIAHAALDKEVIDTATPERDSIAADQTI